MAGQNWLDDETPVETGDYADIEDGTYEVTCTNLERVERDDWQGDTVFLKMTFAVGGVVDANGEPVELTAFATFSKVTPKTKLGKWYSTLTGQKVEGGGSVVIRNMLGKKAMALVVNKEKDDGSKWAGIENLIPLPKAGAKSDGKIADSTIAALEKALDTMVVERDMDDKGLADWLVDNGFQQAVSVVSGKSRIRLERYSEAQAQAVLVKIKERAAEAIMA